MGPEPHSRTALSLCLCGHYRGKERVTLRSAHFLLRADEHEEMSVSWLPSNPGGGALCLHINVGFGHFLLSSRTLCGETKKNPAPPGSQCPLKSCDR